MRPQLLLAALTALVSSACYSPGDGLAPPLKQLYFPTGLALDTSNAPPDDGYEHRYELKYAPGFLYAASSDFDLQYRSSGLISFDLGAISNAVPHSCTTHTDCMDGERCDTLEEARADLGASLPDLYVPGYVCVVKGQNQPCGAAGEQGADGRLLYPGRCKPLDLTQHSEFIHDQVGIGAFATNVIFAHSDANSGDVKSRLFLPVRGDATLHWIDVKDGKLNCDQQTTDDDSCGDSHRAGHDPAASNDNISQPAEPFGIAITDTGSYLALTNQTSGSVSLYTHDWQSAMGPQLVSLVGNLPQAPVAIAAVPQIPDPANDFAPSPGFLVAYRNAAQIDLLRVRNDDADNISPDKVDYSRYALTYAGSSAIAVNSLGYDSRDIVIDDSKRRAACDPTDTTCLLKAPQPDVYVANRAPSSLLVGSMTADPSYASGSSDLPAFTDSISLTTGPSRVVLGSVRVPPTGHAQDATHGIPDDDLKTRDPKAPSPGRTYDLEPRVFIVCFDSTRIFVYDPTRHVIDSIIDTGRGPYAFVVDNQRGLGYVAFFTDSYLGVVSLDQRYSQTYATVIANIGTPTPPRTSK